MSNLVPLGPEDTNAAQELIEATYSHIFNNPDTVSTNPRELAIGSDCLIVGNAVQKAARELDIQTSQELHFGHMVTSFTQPDSLPRSNDQILCFTWGQFLPLVRRVQLTTQNSTPYFGVRSGIRPQIGDSFLMRSLNYARAYASTSLIVKVEAVGPDEHHELVLRGPHYKQKLRAFRFIGNHLL